MMLIEFIDKNRELSYGRSKDQIRACPNVFCVQLLDKKDNCSNATRCIAWKNELLVHSIAHLTK